MIYFFWGGTKLSFLRYLTLYSACKFNRDVTLILRRNKFQSLGCGWAEQQDFLNYQGIDYTAHALRLPMRIQYLEDDYPMISDIKADDVHTSDLLSWYILATHGGTVSDMDILFVGPVPVIEYDIGLICFDQYPRAGYIPVSFMQGKPNSFFVSTYQRAVSLYQPNDYESCGTKSICGSFDEIKKMHGMKVKRLPSELITPFAEQFKWFSYRQMMFMENHQLPRHCIGIHWFAGHNQSYNCLYDHSNYKDIDCTISNAIGKIYDGMA